jgi:hypothetical protein
MDYFFCAEAVLHNLTKKTGKIFANGIKWFYLCNDFRNEIQKRILTA